MPNVQADIATSLEVVKMKGRWTTWLVNQEETIRRSLILAGIYLLPALWILKPVITDNDIWWHLQTGKWIVEHGTVPTTDPFSTYGQDRQWVAYSWLFEVTIYWLVRMWGEGAIIAYTLFMTWMILVLLHRLIASRCDNFIVMVSLLITSVVCMSKLMVPRTLLLTVVFFTITVEAVLSLREGKTCRWVWLLPFCYVLWANTHIQFVYGLALLGLSLVSPVIDRYVRPFTGTRPVMEVGSSNWRRLVVITGLCVLATFVTPYHVQLYSIALDLSAQTGMWEYLQEMQAPSFRFIADWAMLGLLSFVLVALGRHTASSSFELLLFLVAVVCAFRGQRDVWFLVLACVAVLVSRNSKQSTRQSTILCRLWPTAAWILIGTMWIGVSVGFSQTKIHENTAKVYPVEAASFVEQQGYAGPLYNHFDWGGYLIWRLPHLKVSMDGRANVHGDDRIKRSISTWTGTSHWTEDPELNEANVVIAQRELALSALLRLDPRFQMAYQDDIAVVFTRSPRNAGQSHSSEGEGPFHPSTVVHVASAP